jgi:uncharacterized membrane protein
MASTDARFESTLRTDTSPALPAWASVRPHRVLQLLHPEWVFLAVALSFGCLSLVLTPPLQVPDEAAHFYRSFRMAEGIFVGRKEGVVTGDQLPRVFTRLPATFGRFGWRPECKTSSTEILATMKVPIDTADREFFEFSNTAVHPPLIYLPQAVGILIARLLSGSLLASFYAGRLANLLVCTALIFIAIRRAPIGKWAFEALGLTPMALFLMASLSSDALTNAISFLLVAQVLKCAFGDDQFVSRRDLGLLVILGIALGLTKQAYFFLGLSFVLIPVARFPTPARYWGAFAAMVLASLLATAGWALQVRHIYSPAVPGKVDPRAQWHYIASHPEDFAQAALTNATIELPHTVAEYFGVLGVRDLPLPAWVPVLELLVLAAACLVPLGKVPITRRQALLAASIAALEFLMILLIINLTWDRVGHNRSVDVQGRYFIPLGPLLAVALIGTMRPLAQRLGRVHWVIPALVTAGACASLTASMVLVFNRYYVDSPVAAAERAFVDGQNLLRIPGQETLAIDHFNEALQWNPAHARAHFNLGVLLARTQPRSSIQHYRAAVAADHSFFEAEFNLASALAREGEFVEAIEHLRAARAIRPDDQNVRSALAAVQAAAARQARRPWTSK